MGNVPRGTIVGRMLLGSPRVRVVSSGIVTGIVTESVPRGTIVGRMLLGIPRPHVVSSELVIKNVPRGTIVGRMLLGPPRVHAVSSGIVTGIVTESVPRGTFSHYQCRPFTSKISELRTSTR